VKLLIVTKDVDQGGHYFHGLGFDCKIANNLGGVLKALNDGCYQVVLIDLNLPEALQIVERIKDSDPSVGILLLAHDGQKELREAALRSGADDFMLAPFDLAEMQARVQAALIRLDSRSRAQAIEWGPLKMDLFTRRVTFHDKLILLTPTEFRILSVLLQNRGSVVSRQKLHEMLWELGWDGVTNVIEVHINRLRTKLRAIADQTVIRTVRGSGYKVDQQSHMSISF
jgi:two-component system OmpR family response regulator/two-component system copper resistance phosphate regulon response regulator CusR